MKIKFDHTYSKFIDGQPLIYVEAEIEKETPQHMLENGWVPINNKVWYQTQAARLKLQNISPKRKKQLKKINICENTNITIFPLIQSQQEINNYSIGEYFDFSFDNEFAGRINYYDNQVFYSMMTVNRNKKSYGTISYYYLINKLKDNYKYLYIADYFDIFGSKSNLPGFEYWNGSCWITNNKEEL